MQDPLWFDFKGIFQMKICWTQIKMFFLNVGNQHVFGPHWPH